MNYNHLYKQFWRKKVFSINELREVDPNFCLANLSVRQKKWYIRNLLRWRYYFVDEEMTEKNLLSIANKIYQPSYISLETALLMYNIIPEAVPNITSISSKKTTILQTDLANYSYKKVKPSLMFGYTLREIKEKEVKLKIASIEKAIIDYLYLYPQVKTTDDFYELRRNIDEILTQRNKETFLMYSKEIDNKSFQKRVRTFISFVESDARHYDY